MNLDVVMERYIRDFVIESNKIEGIVRLPTEAEINEFKRFIQLDKVTVADLEKFVSIYQPEALLRDRRGLDVSIGNYYPPRGSMQIRVDLENLLKDDLNAFNLHVKYERLHPFTDGNGRSGRALWALRNKDISLGFLHAFYYQTLKNL